MSNGGSLFLKRRFLVPLILILFMAAAAWGYWRLYLRGYVSTDDALVDGNDVSISSRVAGRITELAAGEGDTLRAGELVVKLDDTDLLAQAEQAQASIEYAQKSVGVADVNLARAREDFARSEAQFRENIIPRESYDHARRALELAEAQRAMADAQVKNSEAQLEVIRSSIDNTRITSPMDGIVARRWVITGDVVQPGQPILTVFDLKDTWVTAHLEETKLRSIHVGDPAAIKVDAFPGRKLVGKVSLIGAATSSQFSLIPPNNASGNFTKVTQRVPVRISIDRSPSMDGQSAGRLLPGMSAEVKIRTRSR